MQAESTVAVLETWSVLSYRRQIGYAAAERRQMLHHRWYHHHLRHYHHPQQQQQQSGRSRQRNRRDTGVWSETVHADDAGFRRVYT